MSSQYRENSNKRYLKSLYSNATARQNCVPCPSSCSCNLGGRSVMDRLMIQAWQEGPEGHTGVFSHLSGGGHHSAPHHHPHSGHHHSGHHHSGPTHSPTSSPGPTHSPTSSPVSKTPVGPYGPVGCFQAGVSGCTSMPNIDIDNCMGQQCWGSCSNDYTFPGPENPAPPAPCGGGWGLPTTACYKVNADGTSDCTLNSPELCGVNGGSASPGYCYGSCAHGMLYPPLENDINAKITCPCGGLTTERPLGCFRVESNGRSNCNPLHYSEDKCREPNCWGSCSKDGGPGGAGGILYPPPTGSSGSPCGCVGRQVVGMDPL